MPIFYGGGDESQRGTWLNRDAYIDCTPKAGQSELDAFESCADKVMQVENMSSNVEEVEVRRYLDAPLFTKASVPKEMWGRLVTAILEKTGR